MMEEKYVATAHRYTRKGWTLTCGQIYRPLSGHEFVAVDRYVPTRRETGGEVLIVYRHEFRHYQEGPSPPPHAQVS